MAGQSVPLTISVKHDQIEPLFLTVPTGCFALSMYRDGCSFGFESVD